MWWINNNLDIGIDDNFVHILLEYDIDVLTSLLQRGYSMEWTIDRKRLYDSSDLISKLLWCRNNNIAIRASNKIIDKILREYNDFVKYYKLYDWLNSLKN